MQFSQPWWKKFARELGKFDQYPKIMKNFRSSQRDFQFWKFFHGREHCGFHNTAWKETTKNQLFSAPCPKMTKRLPKKTFSTRCPHGHVKCRFYNSVRPEAKNFSFFYRKRWKILNLAQFSICLKKFHWIHRVQFCQFRRKNQQKSVKFRSLSKNVGRTET